MNEVNEHNYEAYFLDFCEGNLRAEQLVALEAFLERNPHLRAELEAFEAEPLASPGDESTPKWKELKRPDLATLKADVNAREVLYCAAIEGHINPTERDLLDELCSDPSFQNEYRAWEKTRLTAEEATFANRDGVYQFGLEEPLGEHNYESYLIAHGEGLLSAEQEARMVAYASLLPEGNRDIRLAKSMKVAPALGIVFPDKEKMRKARRVAPKIWLYRAAAVLFLGSAVWSLLPEGTPTDQPLSENVVIHTDTAVVSKPETVPGHSARKVLKPEAPKVKIEEWEAREPDPVEYAYSEDETRQDMTEKAQESPRVSTPEMDAVETKRAEIARPELAQDIRPQEAELDSPTEKMGKPKNDEYKTLAEIAEEKLSKELSLSDAERDALAMSLAKRLTDKAGALLDAEVQRESQQAASGERITYTLRVGGFKVSHNKAK